MATVTKTRRDMPVNVREKEMSSPKEPQGTPSRLSFREKLEKFRRTEP